MHFQVPQYIDVEDKIIGPLSLKQFFYLLAGGGIIFLLYNVLKPAALIIVSIPIALLSILFAFYKKDNQKFTKFVTNFLGFISKPNIYTWKKSPMKKPEEEPTPEIIKKVEPIKKLPEEKGLEETLWKIELKQ